MTSFSDLRTPVVNQQDDDPAAYVRGMERLVDAVRDLAGARGLRDVVDIVRSAAREVVNADGATFVLRDDDRCYYVDEDAIAPLWRGLRFPMEACISGWAMLNAQQVVIGDIYLDDRIPHEAYRPTFVHSLAMTPIRTADPVGAIGTYWADRHHASPTELKLLQALADSTAVALENVRVLGELEDRVVTRTAQLSAANARLERLAVDAAAGLRDPLERLAAHAAAGGSAAAVEHAAATVEELAGELLALSRTSAGELEAHQRQEWLQACIGITRELLTGGAADPLRSIAHEARRVTAADTVTVLLLSPDEEDLTVALAVGEGTERHVGLSFPAGETISGRAVRSGLPMLVPDARQDPRSAAMHSLPDSLPVGPLMVVPLPAQGRMRGALAIGRIGGGKEFDASDLDLAAAFANHAAIALEFADARAVRQEIALLEDRDKIAQSLYDEVIHRLFAAGLAVQGVAAGLDSLQGDRLRGAIGAIDETITQMRAAIYGLRGPTGRPAESAYDRLLGVVAEFEPRLPAAPGVHFDGPIDAVVPARLVDDALLVLREALAEVALNGAGRIDVSLSVVPERDEFVLEVSDDCGRGRDLPLLGPLANLRALAELRGGSLTMGHGGRAGHAGTVLRWVVPLA
jgi:GAF domain-containing protein